MLKFIEKQPITKTTATKNIVKTTMIADHLLIIEIVLGNITYLNLKSFITVIM